MTREMQKQYATLPQDPNTMMGVIFDSGLGVSTAQYNKLEKK
jgi:hypothetical protein